jgi:hypothetical protein
VVIGGELLDCYGEEDGGERFQGEEERGLSGVSR